MALDWDNIIITTDEYSYSIDAEQRMILFAGAPGQTPSIEVVETETLDPGEDAYVENLGTTQNVRLKFGIPRGPSAVWGTIIGNLADQTDLQNALDEKADIIHTSASGSLVHITDGAAYPVDALSVGIEPVQDLHGYDAPWPAGGGKNLLKDAETMNGWDKASSYVSISDGVATFRGSSSSWDGRLGTAKYPISLYDGTTNYVWSFEYSSTTDPCLVVPVIASFSQSETDSGYTRTKFKTLSSITLANTGGEWVKVQVFSRTISVNDLTDGSGSANSGGLMLYNRSNNLTIQVRHMQLEIGSTATDFAPYSNICPISGHADANIFCEDEYNAGADPAITIDLNGTRYGGSLNVLTGVLTLDKQYIEVNGVDYTFTKMSSAVYAYTYVYSCGALGDRMLPNLNTDITTAICNYLPSISRVQAGAGNNKIGIFQYHSTTYQDELRLAFPLKSEYDSTDKIYALGVTCVIPLREEYITTVQLDPETLTLLLGENNIWADTGDTSVSYRADTKLYIDGKLAAAIAELQALI